MKFSFEGKWLKISWIYSNKNEFSEKIEEHTWYGLVEEDNADEKMKDKRKKRHIKVQWFKRGNPPKTFIRDVYEYSEFAQLINQKHIEICE